MSTTFLVQPVLPDELESLVATVTPVEVDPFPFPFPRAVVVPVLDDDATAPVEVLSLRAPEEDSGGTLVVATSSAELDERESPVETDAGAIVPHDEVVSPRSVAAKVQGLRARACHPVIRLG